MPKKPVLDSAPKRITGLNFGIFSQKDVLQQSVIQLWQRNLYEPGSRREKAKFGALDIKMGVSEKNVHCDTCGEDLYACVGHFGSLQLVLPVFHIGYFRLTLNILQAICKCCSRVMLQEDVRRSYLRRLRSGRLDYVQKGMLFKAIQGEAKKCTSCPYCHQPNGTVKKVGALKIEHIKYKNKTKNTPKHITEYHNSFEKAVEDDAGLKSFVSKAQESLDALKVLNLLRNISDEDVELLGLDPKTGRPEMFIWTSMPVPPVPIRPTVQKEDGENADDITVLISEIIDTNTKLRTFIDSGQSVQLIRDHWDYLQLQIAMYVNCDLSGVPPTVAKNIQKIKKGFVQRLKGKQGRFRGNLSGKRVDYSGRTVISPDPNMRVDQVAVPQRMAKVLTYPERVTRHNIERLKKAVANGPEVHPGAIYVHKLNKNIKFALRASNPGVLASTARDLEYGDTVHRHLIDGDVVLFNRQPSLHKLSIMSHYAKVMPWRTLRFNECVCSPYNADFDGDEMNLHLPQTEEARAEAVNLMQVKKNLVTPRDGSMLIAATQDFITCSYLITRKDTFYDRTQMVQICTYMGDGMMKFDIPPPAILKPAAMWTGKQIVSLMLRPNKDDPVLINLETKNKSYSKPKNILPDLCPSDGWTVIFNSELVAGVLDKSIVGDSKNGMFYAVLREYGSEYAASCMNRLAKLAARWMMNQGFSIGISDVQPGEILYNIKENKVFNGYTECDGLITQSQDGKLSKQAGMTNDETLEAKLGGVLSKIREDLGDICLKELSPHNAPLIMSVCGSKGSKLNVCQMVACVGQQIISGKRIPDGFGDRALPHFPKKSKIPNAKGFVRNSFYSGLTPTEFIFHAVSGREGLVDTAVKTAETGYMQRRLMKALEDLVVHYDNTVRNSADNVVQFVYGRDGLDPAEMESEQTEQFPDGRQVKRMFPIALDRAWLHSGNCLTMDERTEPGLLPWEIRECTKDTLNECFSQEGNKQQVGKEKNVEWVRSQIEKFVESTVVQKIVKLRTRLGLPAGETPDESNGQKMEIESEPSSMPVRRTILSTAKRQAVMPTTTESQQDEDATAVGKVTRKQLQRFLQLCARKYQKSILDPGTAIGAICGQSLGEPGTQMTLKTFHFAGLASANITMGVPRIKEVINATASIATPIITVHVENPTAETFARVVKGRLEKTLLKDVSRQMRETITSEELSLQFTVDQGTLNKLNLDITTFDIADAIARSPRLKLDRDLIVARPNSVKVIIPCRGKTEEEAFFILQGLKRVLPNVTVAGIPTVGRAIIEKFTDDEKDSTGRPIEKHKLIVEGYGFRECLNTTGVAWHKTRPNHILDIQKYLGIEAARTAIVDEILVVMTSHGISLDERHVALLADLMTFKGMILGITRTGISKMRDSVLMLASFEKTPDHLFEAAFFGKKDPIVGVSESIIMGNPMGVGTGLVRLLQEVDATPIEPKNLLFDKNELHIPLLSRSVAKG